VDDERGTPLAYWELVAWSFTFFLAVLVLGVALSRSYEKDQWSHVEPVTKTKPVVCHARIGCVHP
jgi:uncharacterized protein (DUF58 family)